MIETPHLTHVDAQQIAVIHLTIPRAEIQAVMGPAIGEVMAAVQAQHVGPAGPFFSHHFRMQADVFDFEVGVPVFAPVTPTGRVHAGSLPAASVVRTVFHGDYSGLGSAWEELRTWATAQGHQAAPNLWEVYAKGPESDPDPATWRTELNQPLL